MAAPKRKVTKSRNLQRFIIKKEVFKLNYFFFNQILNNISAFYANKLKSFDVINKRTYFLKKLVNKYKVNTYFSFDYLLFKQIFNDLLKNKFLSKLDINLNKQQSANKLDDSILPNDHKWLKNFDQKNTAWFNLFLNKK